MFKVNVFYFLWSTASLMTYTHPQPQIAIIIRVGRRECECWVTVIGAERGIYDLSSNSGLVSSFHFINASFFFSPIGLSRSVELTSDLCSSQSLSGRNCEFQIAEKTKRNHSIIISKNSQTIKKSFWRVMLAYFLRGNRTKNKIKNIKHKRKHALVINGV